MESNFDNTPTSFSLTEPQRQQVREWVSAREKALEEVKRWQAEAAKYSALIDSVARLLPQSEKSLLFTTETTWADMILAILADAKRGCAYSDFIARIKGTPFETKFTANPNGLYNTVAKLIDRGKIVKRGKLFFLPDDAVLLNEFSGEPDATEQPNITSFVLGIFKTANRPLAGRDLLASLQNHPVFGPKVRRNPNYVYSIIARLCRQEKLIKRADGYAYPGKETASDGGQTLFPD